MRPATTQLFCRTTGLLLLAVLSACDAGETRPDRDAILSASWDRNILIVLLDAAAASHFSSYGYDRPTTPRIDAIAQESIRFEQAYAQASGTAMSMYSTFTSRYPVLQAVPELRGENAVVLSDSLSTLPEALASRMSARLMISTNPFVSAAMGFGQGITTLIEDWEPGSRAREGLPPKYAERVTGPALAWIREQPTEPWFAYLHYLEPHAPYMPPEPYRSRLKRREADLSMGDLPYLRNLGQGRPPIETQERIIDLYDGNLAWVDSEVGALVDSLRADGTWDNTVFVLLSDHGEGFWQHRTKGHGGIPYEEVVRIPLLVRIPGIAPQVIETPVELVDLMPTLLDLAGIDRHEFDLVGRSWLPLITGEEADARFPDDRVLHLRSNRTRNPVFALRRGPWKWLLHVHDGKQELFDLRTDPGEQHDLLAGGQPLPEQAADFPELLERWLAEGLAQSAGSASVDNETLDPTMVESLRSLGYIE